jgi:hypothetical protein
LTCSLLRRRGRDTLFFCSGLTWRWNVTCLRTLLICAASECRREGDAWGGEGGRELPSRCGLGCPLGLLFLQFLLRVSAGPIVGGMGFFSFRQPAVAACWGGCCVPLLGALFVEVSAPAPLTTRRVFAICPDVAELLAVVALRKKILGSVCLHPDSTVTEARQTENFLGLCPPWQSYEE